MTGEWVELSEIDKELRLQELELMRQFAFGLLTQTQGAQNPMSNETATTESVTIRATRLRELEDIELKYQCLEGAGVDNWSGWDDAMADYREAKTERTEENTA